MSESVGEEVVRKNLMAMKFYNEETRKLVRELESKLNLVDMLNAKIQALESQVRALQVKTFSGGATAN